MKTVSKHLTDAATEGGVRCGAKSAELLAASFAVAAVFSLAALLVGDFGAWLRHRGELLATFAVIGCWRWGWFLLQTVRAAIYRYVVYPMIRRRSVEAVKTNGPVPELTILAVTYKEEEWITRAVLLSIFDEIDAVEGLSRPATLVVGTGCDSDDEAIRRVYGDYWKDRTDAPELMLLRGDSGKRPAIVDGLRAWARTNPDPDGVLFLMDGDTLIQPGLMKRTLPVFRLDKPVYAVTTNENGYVRGPGWFAEWISLRFGLRHRSMCSISLSGSLLCLTGRLSGFRASVASDPSFIRQIERDEISHWLWGRFEMLSGDDKSTWYWLAERCRRMLYIPDATATTIEVVKPGTGVKRALANIRRWSGNSLRHSGRAIRLGPERLGWFCWYSLLDQRLAIFTVLIGPAVALLGAFSGNWHVCSGYIAWILMSRCLHAAISWYHGRRFSIYYIPLQIVSEWAISLTKVWVLFHPAKQAWMNRGGRSMDTTAGDRYFGVRNGMAHYLSGFSIAMILLCVGLTFGFIPLFSEAPLLFGRNSHAETAPKVDLSIGGSATRPSGWMGAKPSPVTAAEIDSSNRLRASVASGDMTRSYD